MKRYIYALFVFLILLSTTACEEQITSTVSNHSVEAAPPSTESPDQPQESPSSTPPRIMAEVTRVIDGDTFKIRLDNKEERVRMILIDTPESVHPTKPPQPYGK